MSSEFRERSPLLEAVSRQFASGMPREQAARFSAASTSLCRTGTTLSVMLLLHYARRSAGAELDSTPILEPMSNVA